MSDQAPASPKDASGISEACASSDSALRLAAPRLMIAGMAGDAGKTTVCAGLLRTLRRRGLRVQAFKKGPDYIDAAWLSLASGSVARNLDVYLSGEDEVRSRFARHAATADCSLIEGNRGLFDGVDAQGSFSTSRLATIVECPVLLVLSAAKVTRSLAAVVLGAKLLEPGLRLGGVVLNGLSGDRHRAVAVQAIEELTGVPVLGALPRVAQAEMPSRHLGLVTPAESPRVEERLDALERLVTGHIDVDAVLALARSAPPITANDVVVSPKARPHGVRIGVLRDAAFTFYYPENLEQLEALGATLVTVSPLSHNALPPVDALYIGGGFPETHARELSNNRSLLRAIREAAQTGLPIYAECGGLMYLGRAIHCGEESFEMAGVFPIETAMLSGPAGHGYVNAEVVTDNPFLPVGTRIRGHEFHYSRVVSGADGVAMALQVTKGNGVHQGHDGLRVHNVLATYVHVHASGTPEWAPGLVCAAQRRAAARSAVGLARPRAQCAVEP